MTVTLPADPETERLARRLAEVTGRPLPAVVKDAIAAKAEAAGLAVPKHAQMSRANLLARMTEIADGFARLPVLDARTPDDIIGYDEHGVPR